MIKNILKITVLILWVTLGLNFLSKQSIKLDSGFLTKPDGSIEELKLPHIVESTQKGIYTFDIKFNPNSLPPQSFQIWVDDCLEKVTLNNTKLSHIGSSCLDFDGLIINFENAYTKGENHFQIKIKELGGKLKLVIKPYAKNKYLSLLEVVYLIGIVFFWNSLTKNLVKNRFLLNCLALAFILRFLFIYFLHPLDNYIFSDMAGHERRANEILAGTQSAKHVEKPPGFQYIVALSLNFFKNYELIKFMHLILSLLTCYFVAEASKHFFGKRGSNLILAIMSVHVPLIFLGGILMEECLYAFILSYLFLLLVKNKSYFKSGLAFGLAFCLKGTHVFFPPLAALFECAFSGVKPASRRWFKFFLGAVFVLGLQLTITRQIYGTAKFPSAGAVNFLEGKCEGGNHTDITGAYRYSPLYSQIGRKRLRVWDFSFDQSDKVWAAGLNCIKENPYVLISSISSVYYLFHGNNHWPFNETIFSNLNKWYGMVFSFFVFPGILIGFVKLIKTPKKILPFLPAFSLLITVWFFKSEVRFRVPFDVMFIPLSALGWSVLIKSIYAKNHKKILFAAGMSYVFVIGFAVSMEFLNYLIT